MLTNFPPTYRKSQPRVRAAAAPPTPPPPAGPTLTAGSFDKTDGLTLTFAADVQLVGFDPAGIVVDDPDSASSYVATAVGSVVGASVVGVPMEATGPSAGTTRTLTATAATGIVSADTGTPWAGVTDFPLGGT